MDPLRNNGGTAPFSDMSSSTNIACNWRQTDVDPEDLKRWRERAQSANKLQFLMMSGKHVARGVTKPTGRKKGKCATMRT